VAVGGAARVAVQARVAVVLPARALPAALPASALRPSQSLAKLQHRKPRPPPALCSTGAHLSPLDVSFRNRASSARPDLVKTSNLRKPLRSDPFPLSEFAVKLCTYWVGNVSVLASAPCVSTGFSFPSWPFCPSWPAARMSSPRPATPH